MVKCAIQGQHQVEGSLLRQSVMMGSQGLHVGNVKWTEPGVALHLCVCEYQHRVS